MRMRKQTQITRERAIKTVSMESGVRIEEVRKYTDDELRKEVRYWTGRKLDII